MNDRHVPSDKLIGFWNSIGMSYIVLYLAAIVIANMMVHTFGPVVSVLNAFLFIGLDLTSRDKLHEMWIGRFFPAKMTILIGVGSLLTYIVNSDAQRIAIASFVAFIATGAVDTIVYHLLVDKKKFYKINGSNVLSAAADSVIFPTIAFGEFLPLIVVGQYAAKVMGGYIWSMLLASVEPVERIQE